MVLRHYLPPKLIVFHNDQVTLMPPMMVLRKKGKARSQLLNLMSKSILRHRDFFPQGMSQNLAGEEVIGERHDVLIVPRTIIIVWSARECIRTIGGSSNVP
jgi:hypothetical protein